jgi:phage N-6-adenine-methyltransferase
MKKIIDTLFGDQEIVTETGMFSSDSADWATDQRFFDRVNSEFHFNLDVCATKENAKCPLFITKEQNALRINWYHKCVDNKLLPIAWMNPPYGDIIKEFMRHAKKETAITLVALVPARTDTLWWHESVMKADEIRLIKGRLSFNNYGSAPFPSALVIFRPEFDKQSKGQFPILRDY